VASTGVIKGSGVVVGMRWWRARLGGIMWRCVSRVDVGRLTGVSRRSRMCASMFWMYYVSFRKRECKSRDGVEIGCGIVVRSR